MKKEVKRMGMCLSEGDKNIIRECNRLGLGIKHIIELFRKGPTGNNLRNRVAFLTKHKYLKAIYSHVNRKAFYVPTKKGYRLIDSEYLPKRKFIRDHAHHEMLLDVLLAFKNYNIYADLEYITDNNIKKGDLIPDGMVKTLSYHDENPLYIEVEQCCIRSQKIINKKLNFYDYKKGTALFIFKEKKGFNSFLKFGRKHWVKDNDYSKSNGILLTMFDEVLEKKNQAGCIDLKLENFIDNDDCNTELHYYLSLG